MHRIRLIGRLHTFYRVGTKLAANANTILAYLIAHSPHMVMRAGDNAKVELARPPLVQGQKCRTGGTSGLHRTA